MTASARRWVGGFNLLPWRRGEARVRRRRVLLQWLAAALVGFGCAAPFAGWRVWQRMDLDRERHALAPSLARLRAPLAEQRRLMHEADERRRQVAASQQRAAPLTRLLQLLDQLATADVDGVALHRAVHRAGDTELHASLTSETVTAAWLAQLRALPGVAAVSVREMKRRSAGAARADDGRRAPLQATAQLTWAGLAAGPSQPQSRREVRTRGGE